MRPTKHHCIRLHSIRVTIIHVHFEVGLGIILNITFVALKFFLGYVNGMVLLMMLLLLANVLLYLCDKHKDYEEIRETDESVFGKLPQNNSCARLINFFLSAAQKWKIGAYYYLLMGML